MGIVLLKRLADAVADGDSIRAVLRSAAFNNDGAARVGFTAPVVDGQRRALQHLNDRRAGRSRVDGSVWHRFSQAALDDFFVTFWAVASGPGLAQQQPITPPAEESPKASQARADAERTTKRTYELYEDVEIMRRILSRTTTLQAA